MLTFGLFPMAASAQSIPGYQVTGELCERIWTLAGKKKLKKKKAQTEKTN